MPGSARGRLGATKRKLGGFARGNLMMSLSFGAGSRLFWSALAGMSASSPRPLKSLHDMTQIFFRCLPSRLEPFPCGKSHSAERGGPSKRYPYPGLWPDFSLRPPVHLASRAWDLRGPRGLLRAMVGVFEKGVTMVMGHNYVSLLKT